MQGITKLNISKYDQMGSYRPLENAYHAATGRCCEIEEESKFFVDEGGELYTTTKQLRNWYRKRGNISSEPVTIIIDHDKKQAYIAENPDDIPDAHERKWRRFKLTVYHNEKEKEFAAFGEEYSIDEIKSRADELFDIYMPHADVRSTNWQTSDNTHTKTVRNYKIEIYVIP